MLMKQTFSFILAHPLTYRDELPGHQFGDFLARVGREAHIAICEDADQFAG